MYRDIRANTYFLYNDFRFSLVVFWSIFTASVLLLFALSLSFSLETTIIISPSMAIFFFCGFSGYLTVKDSFPFMIKMGSTRSSFVVSVMLFNLILSLFMATVSLIMTEVISLFNRLTQNDHFQLYTTIQLTTLNETWIYTLLLDFFVCFFLLTAFLLIGSLFYRFGLIGGGSVLAIVLIINLIANIRHWLMGLFLEFQEYMITINFVNSFLLLVTVMITIWIILQKAPTTSKPTR
ncbi:hypothetical protein ACERJO_18305 [Halalkalibacter sp. AB-rgal2]|uniref:hypothetical protein n=1 Tax=Halalkalibacter sp. AB-rgal2 TaxID=3242695 RepID=UPI00359CD035